MRVAFLTAVTLLFGHVALASTGASNPQRDDVLSRAGQVASPGERYPGLSSHAFPRLKRIRRVARGAGQELRRRQAGHTHRSGAARCLIHAYCEIVAGRSPASTFYEDDVVLGLLTIGPVTTGHAMVIPKQHFAYLNEMDEVTGRHLWTVTQRAAEALRHPGLLCEGVNLFLADGKAAFQDISHVHMHVFPRYAGDPFTLGADWSIKPARAELDDVAARIRAAYERLWKHAIQ